MKKILSLLATWKSDFYKGVVDIMQLKPFPSMGWVEELHYFKGQGPFFYHSCIWQLFTLATIIGHYRGFNKFWHKGVVQHNRQALFWKALLSRGSGGMPPPRKFWNPRLSQTHYPLFWGLFLLCFVALRCQPIWKFGGTKKLNTYSSQLFIEQCTIYQHKKEHNIKV